MYHMFAMAVSNGAQQNASEIPSLHLRIGFLHERTNQACELVSKTQNRNTVPGPCSSLDATTSTQTTSINDVAAHFLQQTLEKFSARYKFHHQKIMRWSFIGQNQLDDVGVAELGHDRDLR